MRSVISFADFILERKVSMKRIIYLLIAFLLISGGAIAQTQDGPITEDIKLRIIKRYYDDISDSARWEIKAVYPELRLKGDKPADGFSRVAKNAAMKYVAEFKKSMSSFTAEDRKFLPKGMNFYLEINYSIEHLDDDFVSIKFWRSEYTGGVHPNSWSFTLNYDLKNEKALALSDLFKKDSNFLEVISSNSITQTKKKQGENYDPDWVKQGAGEKIKNFGSWNITKKGLKFTFDAYQVGSYAEGAYESLVPYEKFGLETQSKVFYKVVSISYVDGNPPNWCRNGHFPRESVEFGLARVTGKKGTRAYFYNDQDSCPNGKNCRRKSYVIPGDRLIVSRKYGNKVCSWYQPKKGDETVGWILASKLDIYSPNKKPLFNKWLGNWESHGDNLNIARGKKAGTLRINGNAFWRGLGDNIHIGEVDDKGVPKGNKLDFGGTDKYDCRLKMQLIDDLLVVSDNMNCGGANVTFSGVYSRTELH